MNFSKQFPQWHDINQNQSEKLENGKKDSGTFIRSSFILYKEQQYERKSASFVVW